MLVKENIELEEIWWDNLKAKISQIRHPKGWDLMVKRWADGMKDKKHRDHPQAWAQDVAREFRGADARQLIKYINRAQTAPATDLQSKRYGEVSIAIRDALQEAEVSLGDFDKQ